MIADAIDTAVTLIHAAIVWAQIVFAALVFVFIVCVVCLAACVARDEKTPRRGSIGPLAAERPPSDPESGTTAERPTEPRPPAWARTDKDAA